MRRNSTRANRRYESCLPGKRGRPTTALPGSPEKIQVLSERASQRQELHVPGDVIRAPDSRLNWTRAGNGAFVLAETATVQDQPEPGEQREVLPARGDHCFPEQLRRLRQEAGMTMKALARHVGISRRHLYYLETGQREPTLRVLLRLAQLFRTSLDGLVGAA